MKILISGGHLTPALAVIDYIQKHHPETEIVFVGIEVTQKKIKQKSKEKIEIEKRNIYFVSFNAIKLSELASIQYCYKFIFFIKSCISALGIVLKTRPSVMVSFGGYVAVPLAIASFLLRIPIVTHEQTRVAGFANKFISKMARKIGVSYSETLSLFPAKKRSLTGNPIRSQLFLRSPKPKWLKTTKEDTKPILYITGGNQGSQIINNTVSQILPRLTQNWLVIHQCGTPTLHQNYKRILSQQKRKLSKTKQQNYYIREWLSETELAWIYQHASAAISRSGANTSLELMLFAIPTVFIPLPFSYQNEQFLNAQAYQKENTAIVLKQQQLSPESLLDTSNILLKKNASFKKRAQKLAKKLSQQKAEEKLYQLIVSVTS